MDRQALTSGKFVHNDDRAVRQTCWITRKAVLVHAHYSGHGSLLPPPSDRFEFLIMSYAGNQAVRGSPSSKRAPSLVIRPSHLSASIPVPGHKFHEVGSWKRRALVERLGRSRLLYQGQNSSIREPRSSLSATCACYVTGSSSRFHSSLRWPSSARRT